MSCSSPVDANNSGLPPPPPLDLPLLQIPGSYGFPVFGAFKDRLNYFYIQGRDEFFRSRIQKYQSTVFRVNMPPGPLVSSDPRVIVLLDSKSFPVLLDTSKVEKRDVLDGTYMPSTSLTGGYRVCAFLDPSEPKHQLLKGFFLSLVSQYHGKCISLFRTCLSKMFLQLEDEVSEKRTAEFGPINDIFAFELVFKLFCGGKDPSTTEMKSEGPKLATKWIFAQLAPLATLGLPVLLNFVEDVVFHTLPFPSFLVKPHYAKIYDAFYQSATTVLDEAERIGIKRDEACHNLVFLAVFNAYGGMKAWFPILLKWVGSAGEELHSQLADEVRTVIGSSEGGITLSALNKLPLTKSVVYEALRIEPPIPFQYGKAKEDMIICSHDAAFKIKKGEMICGYQPFATKDDKVFANPEEFMGHRFVGEEGEELLKYVYWSNGRETDDPAVGNKQCPGKDIVILLSRLMLVEFFLRYDTFTVEAKATPFGSTVAFTSLTKKMEMKRGGYILRMKTDDASWGQMIKSDLKEFANAAKKLASDAIKLGSLGFGTSFLQWVASFAALYLLILDRTNWRTNILTGLLVPYVFFSLPSVLFSFFRGDVGQWIAFIAGILRLFFPSRFPDWLELPGALILIIVVAPSLFATTIRSSWIGAAICLVIGCYLLQEHIRASGGFRNSFTRPHGVSNTIGILLLLVYPVWAIIVYWL